ncbi:MAG: universal stress protein [Blastocatellia bacterium]
MTERMKMLIGDDGSESARGIPDDLARAGLPEFVAARVLAVADVWLPPPMAGEGKMAVQVTPLAIERAQEAARAKVEEMGAIAAAGADRLRAAFPAWEVTSEALADSPSWGILKRASEWGAELIVVAAHGQTGFSRLTVGSVSRKVVSEASCSVRVVRQAAASAQDQAPRLVIGLDGSSDADLALRAVRQRQWPAGTEVHLVTAIDEKVVTGVFHPNPSHARWIQPSDEQPLRWVERMLATSAAELTAAGLAVIVHQEYGDPKQVLLDIAHRVGASTIFVGAKGHRLIERILIGSVSSSILARAECSVEVIR